MRRGVLGMAWGLVLAAAIAAGGPAMAAAMTVRVSPRSGGPHTAFRLRFRLPAATGTFASLHRADTVSVSGPAGTGCQTGTALAVRSARAGSTIRITLRPQGRRSWCAGTFHGVVVQRITFACPPNPARACPLVEIAPLTIGRFRFTVKARAGGGGSGGSGGGGGGGAGSGPTFAGLISATYCAGIRPVLPLARVFTLTWNAASDPSTPSSEIVYDVYEAGTPGGENFATPTWTTAAGATQYVTPSRAVSGAVYFVVRALDAAGREDANTVEVQAVNHCIPVQ